MPTWATSPRRANRCWKWRTPSHLRLEADVPEALVDKVKLGDALPVRVDALETNLTGVVSEIAPSADSDSRTFVVKLDLPPDHRLARRTIWPRGGAGRRSFRVARPGVGGDSARANGIAVSSWSTTTRNCASSKPANASATKWKSFPAWIRANRSSSHGADQFVGWPARLDSKCKAEK